ncbi:MAG: Modmolybdate transport system substrate-binding protein ModA [Syntrophus sp. SKADARSKE-3]|nr:Modmolybdate transport system substrate-binding protein ModA [Syntrophus sp. SKADARSKE-3]
MKRALYFISFFLLFSFVLVVSPAVAEGKIKAAVAANFIAPFQELSKLFTARTGIPVEATYSSTGQLYAQIVNGAPYDLFLSADQERPAVLHKEGRADPPLVYAVGRVVLWVVRKNICSASNWQKALVMPGVKKIAIANPRIAPYGAAAEVALKKTGLMENVSGKLVFAQNIAQSFQYASTGSVDAGFCALSAVLSEEGRKGCTFAISEAPSITQSACLLKRTGRNNNAETLLKFLTTPEAVAIKKKYGYY